MVVLARMPMPKRFGSFSWRHKITQPKSSTASTAGGHTAERTEHEEMFFTKDIDSASPKLWHAASAGTYYDLVEVYFYRALGGKNTSGTDVTRVNYLKVEMKDVIVSSVETNIGSGELPAETFGLKYSAIKWTYNRAGMWMARLRMPPARVPGTSRPIRLPSDFWGGWRGLWLNWWLWPLFWIDSRVPIRKYLLLVCARGFYIGSVVRDLESLLNSRSVDPRPMDL